MSEPDFSLAQTRVAIVGLGLMGGSLALDLRGKCAAVYGVDPDPDTQMLARTRGIVAKISGDLADILPEADLVILAAPVRVIVKLVQSLPDAHPGTAVIMDIGSTKTDIVAAMAALPPRFDPIGGHPMCGREVSSLVNAYTGMYRGAPFALTPLPRTTTRAQALAAQVVAAVGANLLWLDAATHDQWVAATSHLPYLVAAALAGATPLDAAPLVGPGFLSTTRLAGSSRQMMLDILATNRAEVLSALARFEHNLAALRQSLDAADWDALLALLAQGAERRQEIVG
ncbi:MAG: prephenate dehydrogenase [Ardenticatenaceae bacterium]|nr:prephenate dehydrogenase [Ardenticatenaceae bacterium]